MLDNKNLISLTEAAKLLPHRPAVQTVWRWAMKGCRGVRLEHIRFGNRIFTSPEALERFAEALTELDADRDESAPAKPRTTRQRQAAISRAETELERAGW